jgi:hypothetical membrane protein
LSQLPDRRNETTRALALCGILAPVVFTIFVAIESFLRPGYSQFSSNVSDLGVGPNAVLQSVNFWVTGLLVIAAAVGMRRALDGNAWPARAGPAFVASAGVGLACAGFFPDSPTPYPGDVHSAVSGFFFLGVLAATFVVRSAQNADPKWAGFGRVSLGFGLAAFVGLFLIGQPPIGLFERAYIGILFLWIAITSAGVLRLTS